VVTVLAIGQHLRRLQSSVLNYFIPGGGLFFNCLSSCLARCLSIDFNVLVDGKGWEVK